MANEPLYGDWARRTGNAPIHPPRRRRRALPVVVLVAAVVAADAVIRCLQRTSRLTRETHELAVLSRTDPLTGLPNRRHVEEHLAASLSAARRHHQPLAVLFIDIDDFKHVNDRFGYEVGDGVLQAVGERLHLTLRAEDLVGRWGGEEFLASRRRRRRRADGRRTRAGGHRRSRRRRGRPRPDRDGQCRLRGRHRRTRRADPRGEPCPPPSEARRQEPGRAGTPVPGLTATDPTGGPARAGRVIRVRADRRPEHCQRQHNIPLRPQSGATAVRYLACGIPRNGKPGETRRRKATGLSPPPGGDGRRATEWGVFSSSVAPLDIGRGASRQSTHGTR
jgi:hypothetical protein